MLIGKAALEIARPANGLMLLDLVDIPATGHDRPRCPDSLAKQRHAADELLPPLVALTANVPDKKSTLMPALVVLTSPLSITSAGVKFFGLIIKEGWPAVDAWRMSPTLTAPDAAKSSVDLMLEQYTELVGPEADAKRRAGGVRER